jgi:3-oxoacid CoA-transferase
MPIQAENIVDIGEIKPMDIDLPGIYVDRIVQATVDKKIELLTLWEEEDAGMGNESDSSAASTESKKASAHERRVRIARRAAKEVSTICQTTSPVYQLPHDS